MNDLRDIGTVPFTPDTFRQWIEAMPPMVELFTLLLTFAALTLACCELLRLVSAVLDRFRA